MRMPFVITFHQWCGRDFFADRDETYTAFETDASQDLKNLETETFKFRFRAATFFWNKTARLYAKNSVNVGICNLGWLIDFFLFIHFCNYTAKNVEYVGYVELVFIFDCSIQGVVARFWKAFSPRLSLSVSQYANLFNL